MAISSGAFHDLALRGDGTIIGWGLDSYGITDVPPGLTNAIAIAAGAFTSAALANNNNLCFASRQSLRRTIYSGSTFTLKSAIACFPISRYQWQFNGTILPSATQASLTLSNLPPTNGGAYRVLVSNLYGAFMSSNIVLTVATSAPLITGQSADQTVAPGTNAVLYVNTDGSLPMSYHWRLNGTNISGATNRLLNLTNLQVTNGGFYDVVVSNDFGMTNSSSMLLHVLNVNEALDATNLTWTTSGDAEWFSEGARTHGDQAAVQSGAVGNGQQSVLQTIVTGPGLMTFWWNVDSKPVSNYLKFSVNGSEQVRISGSPGWQKQTAYIGVGEQTLQWAYLKTDASVIGQDAGWVDQVSFVPGGTPPFITLNPASQVVLLGSNATLNATALGTPPLNYQWQLNLTNLDGATNVSLELANAQLTNDGNYTLVVSNGFGITNSTTAYLNVVDFTEALNATNLAWSSGGDSPWYSQVAINHDGVVGLRSGAITGNQQSTAQTSADGPGTLSFWWKVSSETNNDYVKFSLDSAEQARISGTVNWQQKTYYLAPGPHSLTWSYSKNATINTSSDAAWLDQVAYVAGGIAAFVAANPTDQVGVLSSNSTFRVLAQGTPPISYQWFFNSNAIPDATNAMLTITNIQITNVGTYGVAIGNDYGSGLSTNANLYLLSVYAWGAGRSNTVTSPNYGQSLVPTNLAPVISLAAGGYHSLALQPSGAVAAWGYNLLHQTNVPTSLTNATAIAAGLYHSLALSGNGTVSVWGASSYNLTTVPVAATNVVAIAGGWFHNLALKSNGTVVAWGAGTYQSSSPYFGQSMVPSGLSGVTAVAAGGYHSLALRTNGTVIAWGWNAAGQTNVPVGLSNVLAIAAGGSNSIALKRDGTLVAWGANNCGQSDIPPGLSNVVAISAGTAHTMALKNDGTLVVWGLNGNNQTNLPAGLTSFTAIAAGAFHSLALVADGSPSPKAPLANPVWDQGGFCLSLPTFSRRVYLLEYKNSLADTNWTGLPLAAGNGGVIKLTDPTAQGFQRFYRVRQW